MPKTFVVDVCMCPVLCCAVLCCAVLCCAVLCSVAECGGAIQRPELHGRMVRFVSQRHGLGAVENIQNRPDIAAEVGGWWRGRWGRWGQQGCGSSWGVDSHEGVGGVELGMGWRWWGCVSGSWEVRFCWQVGGTEGDLGLQVSSQLASDTSTHFVPFCCSMGRRGGGAQKLQTPGMGQILTGNVVVLSAFSAYLFGCARLCKDCQRTMAVQQGWRRGGGGGSAVVEWGGGEWVVGGGGTRRLLCCLQCCC